VSELGTEARDLMRRARQGTPPLRAEVRSRLREALVPAAAPGIAGSTVAKLVAVSVVSASAGSTLTWFATRPEPLPSVPTGQPVLLVPPPIVATAAPEREANPPEPPLPSAAAPLKRTTRRATRPAASSPEAAVLSAPAADDISFAAELETLEGILRATDEADWNEAQLRLGAYRSRFPLGRLRTEARVLEVLTLCGEGQVDAARALGRALMEAEEMNPAVRRLDRSCAKPPPAGR